MSLTTKLDSIEPAELARCLFEESSDAIFVFDPRNMDLLDVNPRALEMTGLPRHQLVERGLFEMFDADDGQSLNQLLDACQHTKAFRSNDTYLLRRASEGTLPVTVTVSRLRSAPDPAGIISLRETYIRCNSKQKESELSLRTSEAKHRSLVDNVPVCIHGIDLAGRLTSINPFGLKMLCIDDASEVIGREYLSFVEEPDRSRVADLLNQAFQGQSPSFEFNCFVNGKSRLFSSSFIPIRGNDGGVTALTGTTQDITESHELMSRLQIQDLAINSAQIGITIVDATQEDAPIIQCNPAFERLTGYTREEVMGKNCRLLQAGDSDQKGVRFLRNAVLHGRECTAVVRNYRKHGEVFWNEVSIAPLRDLAGKVTHFVGFQNDVTERVEMQRKLLESESRYFTIFEQAAVGVALTDTNTGQFVQVNQKYCQMIGFSQDEMAKRTFVDITFPEDMADDLANMRRLHAGEITEFTTEKRLIRKNGSVVWVKLTVSPTWRRGEKPRFHIAIVEDITARRRTEQQLAASRKALEDAQARACLGSWEYYPDRQETIWSREMFRLYNRDPALGAPTKIKDFVELVHPQDRELMLNNCSVVWESDQTVEKFDLRTNPANGPMRWLDASVAKIPCSDCQESFYVAGTVIDITERKNTMQELVQSEHRYRSLVDNAPEGIVVLDLELGRFIDFNESAVEVFRTTAETLSESGPWDLSPEFQPDGRESIVAAMELINRALGGETVICEWLHCDSKGRQFLCDLLLTRFPDESRQLVRGSITDISQRKTAEQQLRMTRFAIESTHDAMFVIDCDGNFVDVNNVACERLGYSRQELLAMGVPDINPRYPMDQWREHWNDIKIIGKLFFKSEHVKRDGTILPVEISKSYFKFEGNEYAFAFVRDITEREVAKGKLRERENQLAHVSRMSTMGEMVAGITHEVNQPLYSIVNFSKAVNNSLNAPVDCDLDQIAGWNQQIATAANRAGTIIKRLREFISQQPTNRAPVNVCELVSDAIEFVRFESNRSRVTLDVALLADRAEVSVDRVQVQQVLVNLLINAIEAMDHDTCIERRVTVSVTADNDYVKVSVADKGSGLPDQQDKSIFDAFVSTKPGGMGMGLAISQTIVNSFDGRLWANNNDQAGAVFHFTLPRFSQNPRV